MQLVLINVDTKELETFSDEERSPAYAALSYVWDTLNREDDAQFGEQGSGDLAGKQGLRWGIINNFCQRTKEQGLKYGWVDSSCTEQSTSNDRSSAINAISQGYRGASIWCVYIQHASKPEAFDITEWLLNSWRTAREWTLPDLIAPPKLLFYDQNWCIMGEELLDVLFNNISNADRSCQNGLHCCSTAPVLLEWESRSALCHLREEIIRISTIECSIASASTTSGCRSVRNYLAEPLYANLWFAEASPFLSLGDYHYTYVWPTDAARLCATLLEKGAYADFTGNPTGEAKTPWSIAAYEASKGLISELIAMDTTRNPSRPIENLDISASSLWSYHESASFASHFASNLPASHLEKFISEKFYLWSQWILKNILRIGIGSRHILYRDRRSDLFEQPLIVKSHEPAAESKSCVGTSFSGYDLDLVTSDTDGISISGSEDDVMSLPRQEKFSLVLNDLVDNSMLMFFQALVNELWGPWQVLRIEMAASKARCDPGLPSALTTEVQKDGTCIKGVQGLGVINCYAQGETKTQHPIGFSCHFYKKDPDLYQGCGMTDPLKLSSLKRHILKNHRQPPYCPTCSKMFKSASDRDQHVILRTCSPETSGHVEGISDSQASLIRRDYSSWSGEKLWFYLWEVIFPGSRKPQSAYADDSTDKLCLIFQRFWKSNGKLVLASQLQSTGMLDWDCPNEESDLASIHKLVLTDGINKCSKLGPAFLLDLKKLSHEHILTDVESPAEPNGTVRFASADTELATNSPEKGEGGDEMMTKPHILLSQGCFAGFVGVADRNMRSTHTSLESNKGGGLESIAASSLATEGSFIQPGMGTITHTGWICTRPGSVKNLKVLQSSSRTTGALFCEFSETFNCGVRFELSNLDGWIDHHRYQHLGGMLPSECSCWFCEKTFPASDSGSDVSANFVARMSHISEHIRLDGCGTRQIHKDKRMDEHLHFCNLLPLKTCHELERSLEAVKRLRGKSRDHMVGKTSKQRSKLLNVCWKRRLYESRPDFDHKDVVEPPESELHDTKRRRLDVID
ncbi:Vegetative incompatibility protein HET-E-1 [Apiospora saccharicola]|uniref:Vegetative incompatibility protein HET-E-1 n=1 Tax=Apiospora saccharicola TaxID=335842 RepID=A0ABR1UWC5_9PEZI